MKLKSFLFLFAISLLFFSRTSASYDISVIQQNWLGWTNEVRENAWVKNLIVNENLNSTALSWSEYSKTKWHIDHKRPWQKAYYDFKKITNWFSSKWVSFKKVKANTFSESIGWNNYRCTKEDCTQDISKAVYKTFEMYMREKGKKYKPHYNSIMNPLFSQIWVGITLDESKRKYYITVHYWTEVMKK
ncbi:MAG: hypothetical protein ACD_3C00018G0003 [uncultured bacterium (gcode 4)]|uniref:SCP domain-containing protein n=1 Tax=uncultured bacterium (gcode 4) TaxID=1234023 RepID=K2GES0_9BACT|nr:MAG: hypothetical protein ACD_3C00018G0003 [uncultured bacterium (gcode 4)]